jgi:hypothetical protein
MNQRDILRRGEAQRNTPPEPCEPDVICAQATGCELADEGCPYATFRRQPERELLTCPVTGKTVEWRRE